jgi:uncharacterized tellurite resistance protein B-like protein
MLNIKRFFEQMLLPDEAADQASRTRDIQHATAALLLEVAKSDFEQDDAEHAVILATLRDTFALDEDTLDELVTLAETATRDATDVYQFTQLVNEHYHYDDKIHLIENLWKVAFADGRLDRYEEQFIRKVAGLLYIAHSDFIKAKIDVSADIGEEG